MGMTARICPKGHRSYKSSDCPVCPECEEAKTAGGFLATLSAPARRALEAQGIKTLETLAMYSEADLLRLHGFGPASLPKLREVLKREGMRFRQ